MQLFGQYLEPYTKPVDWHMITIDNDKCNGCGLCVRVCHEHCMQIDNSAVTIDYAFCSTCTQCIAICWRQALSWENTQPVRFDKKLLPSSLQFAELLKQRRTVRAFKRDKVKRQLLREIVEHGMYAPTHNFSMRAIVIDDELIIEQIDEVIFKINQKLHKLFFRPQIVYRLISTFSRFHVPEYLRAKPKLERSVVRGKSFATPPVAIVFVIGDRRTPLTLESAQYALYNMDLYARTKGIGCQNLVGTQMWLNRSNLIRSILGLDKHEKIFATMGLGYPAIKFCNKVLGKNMAIQWNGG